MLKSQDDLVPRRQVIFGIRKAELFGKMNRFVDHVPAVDRGKVLQDFEVEERNAAGRLEQFDRTLGCFLDGIEQHRLDPHLLFCARNANAKRVAKIKRELAALPPHFLHQLLYRALGCR